MKQYLISPDVPSFKANLHSHSTFSDGKITPEELKRLYKEQGYSVFAYSDHNVLIDHSELNDDSFLTLTSTEIDVSNKISENPAKNPCFHLNFFAPKPDAVAMPCFNPRYIRDNHADLRDKQAYIGEPTYEKHYDTIHEIITAYKSLGFLCMLNHPTWSEQTYEDYRELEGVDMLELHNYGTSMIGLFEYNTHVFDRLLTAGKTLYGTATDDNHSTRDMFGGFVMISAPSLTYSDIFEALKNGSFYASQAPLIHEMYLEDGLLHVTTSPAKQIALTCCCRKALVVNAEEGQTVTEAVFDTNVMYPPFVRLTVTDEHGKRAWSQPIYGDFNNKYN
ncbi:MAG: hypothetical protein E7664_05420 [Ruminococcaceae bacterium]|nr:hypothetical protein [Oscillospiraceae bacterium]